MISLKSLIEGHTSSITYFEPAGAGEFYENKVENKFLFTYFNIFTLWVTRILKK